MVIGRIRDELTAVTQPFLHECNFVSLRCIDSFGNILEFRRVGTPVHQGGHLDSLVVVRNHILHESRVGR